MMDSVRKRIAVTKGIQSSTRRVLRFSQSELNELTHNTIPFTQILSSKNLNTKGRVSQVRLRVAEERRLEVSHQETLPSLWVVGESQYPCELGSALRPKPVQLVEPPIGGHLSDLLADAIISYYTAVYMKFTALICALVIHVDTCV